MPKFSFDETSGAWKSLSGKKWVRPIPVNMAGSIVRLFHDHEDGTTEYHDYDLDGRVVVGDGPSDKHLDNIIGGWTTPFSRIKPTTAVEEADVETVEEVEEYKHTELKMTMEVTEIPAFLQPAKPSTVSDDEQRRINAAALARMDLGDGYSHVRYNELVEATFDEIRNLGLLKGGEYAGDVDRLANFRRNGGDLGVPMELIWRVYAAKHWDAIGQYVRDILTGTERVRLEGIEGRIDDLIVYLLLFKAMVDERGTK